jgi:hypothetical protein
MQRRNRGSSVSSLAGSEYVPSPKIKNSARMVFEQAPKEWDEMKMKNVMSRPVIKFSDDVEVLWSLAFDSIRVFYFNVYSGSANINDDQQNANQISSAKTQKVSDRIY